MEEDLYFNQVFHIFYCNFCNQQRPLKTLPPAKALPVTCIFSSDKSSDFLKFIVFFIQRFRHYKMGFVKTKPEFVQKV